MRIFALVREFGTRFTIFAQQTDILTHFALPKDETWKISHPQRAEEYGAPVLFMYKSGPTARIYTYAEWRECVIFTFIIVVRSFQVPVLD